MKLLLFYAHDFHFKTSEKGLPDVPDLDLEDGRENAVVIFFHVEEEDQGKRQKVVQKFVKNAKWLCGKFETRTIVLHSFNHLSASKAPPVFSHEILKEVVERLKRTEYDVMTTPFGYFNEFTIHVGGESLAKVFKEF